MFVVASAIFFAGFLASISVFIYLKSVLVEMEKGIILVEALQVAHKVENVLDQNMLVAEKVSENIDIADSLGMEEFPKDFIMMHLSHYNLNSDFSEISIVNKEGLALVATDENLIGENYSQKDFFRKSLAVGEAQVAPVTDGNGNLKYIISYPIKNKGGSIEGAVIVISRPGIFNEALAARSNEGEKLNIILSDMNGIILFSSEDNRTLKSLGNIDDALREKIMQSNHFPGLNVESIQYEIIQDEINANSDSQVLEFSDDIDGKEEILAMKKVEGYPFFTIIETDKEDHTKHIMGIAVISSMMVGLSALLSGIIIYFSVGYQLRPLDSLNRLLLKAAEGDYLVKMNKLGSSKEVIELVTAFNLMIANVKKSKDEVDKKVNEQTMDINKKKEELESQKSAILNILEDVSIEKENSEALARDLEKFKLAVENVSDHIVITDPDGIVLYANKAVEKITGFSNKEVIGKKAGNIDLWGGLTSKDAYGNFWDTIKNKKKVFIGEFRNKRKNGEEYDAYASVSPVMDKHGNIVFFVGIERDITKEKDVDKAKTEFVSLASHQLRTPLTAINWYVEMMMNGDAGKISKDQKSYLEEVYKGSKRMVELVNSLLNVSRIDLGTFAIDPEPTNFVSVSKDVLSELKPSIMKKKMKIKQSYDRELPLINADQKLLRIVFQNLLSNAVKYTSENGTISIGIKKDAGDVLITVSDNGYGIPEKQQSQIFEKLFRADNARQKETDGTGLGLYVLKSIVEKNNGKVWFDSIENKGTTFYVKMPLTGMIKKEGTKGLSAA